MTVELRPLGVSCNLRCSYCYQNPQRDAGNVKARYDLGAMKHAVLAEGGPFTLFGGEPLLLPKPALEELWRWGYERWGRNSVQTNGTPIDDDHMSMFQRYAVQVGISIDGPGELNAARRAHIPERTDDETQRTEMAIRQLCLRGMAPSLIITLHRRNATRETLPSLQQWLRQLDGTGITSVRLHILELEEDDGARRLALTDDENVEAFESFLAFEKTLSHIKFDLFADMRNLLLANDDQSTCVWNACDPYTTRAVRGVEGQGQSSNCGRTNKDGIDFVKSEVEGFERYLSLLRTPQSEGGCAGCRFFAMCKGQCPGTAIRGDWRLRSSHCGVWKHLFIRLESDLIDGGHAPLSDNARLRQQVVQRLAVAWTSGTNISLKRALAEGECADSEPQVGATERRRIAWVSKEAELHWSDALAHLARAFTEIEIQTVIDGKRPAALIAVDASSLDALAQRLLSSRHACVPLTKIAAANEYQARQQPPLGREYRYWTAIGAVDVLAEFRGAWGSNDSATIGRLLGYPDCCIKAFKASWEDRNEIDPTWAMAQQSRSHVPRLPLDDEDVREFVHEGSANLLWRWLGVRPVSHIPCSFHCVETVRVAAMFVESALSAGFADEMELLHELLRWPLQWSAVSGVMELKTPLMRIVTATDYASQRRVVRLKGDRYPELGGAGLGFPYDNSQLPKTAVPKVLGIRARGDTNHLLNGFSAAEAMDRAHTFIVDSIKDALDGDGSSVIDLGCGNGALLARLQRDVTSLTAFGVDVSAEAVRAAQRVHASGWHRFRRGDLFDVSDLFTESFDCAILMPGRVLEANEHQRGRLVSFLHGRCRNVVFYCYSDLGGHDFSALVRSVGFEPTAAKSAGFAQVCVARNRGLTSVALPPRSNSTPSSSAASRRAQQLRGRTSRAPRRGTVGK